MAKLILFVKVPSTNSRKEDAMEEMLRLLHRLLPNSAPISFEIASQEQFLRFYIVSMPEYKSLIESQLYAQYPDAEVEEINDYLPRFDPTQTAFAQIDFKYSSINSFQTYGQTQEKFLKTLSALLSKTNPSEKVFFQLALKRAGSKMFDRGFKGVRYNLFGKNGSEKFSQDLYIGKLRLAYIAQSQTIAKSKISIVANLFQSVKGKNNSLEKRKWFVPKDIAQQFVKRSTEKGDYWSCAEIATLFHFPYEGGMVSNIVQTSSKLAPAPDTLPTLGNINPQDVSFIGQTNYRNERKVFGIKRIDRRRHLYVVGKTGSGKSKLLELLLISDLQNGKGCCLIDPHGDLAIEVLKYVPKERVKDVIYIDPTDRNYPIGFNPLEPVVEYEARQQLSTFFIAIFKKLFAATWNPRMEHLIRYITLALLETPDSNILGISRILSDTAYRQRVIQEIQDPIVKSFWTNEFSPSDGPLAAEAIIPILNKVGQFVANPLVRNMIGQRKNTLDFEKFMNNGNIVIINLSKGSLGEENTALLGNMFITKIQQAALSRAKISEAERRDFYFYVDEFQNFATDAFSSILSEARKYHLDLTIAHQYIAQLPEDVRATTFGNVGTIITFAIGGDDASYLSKEFAPIFNPDDMINLNTREMYVKMSIDGKLTTPFSAITLDVPNFTTDYTKEIIDYTRLKYTHNKTQVENDIMQWTQSTNPVRTQSEDFPEPII